MMRQAICFSCIEPEHGKVVCFTYIGSITLLLRPDILCRQIDMTVNIQCGHLILSQKVHLPASALEPYLQYPAFAGLHIFR
ncbi:hypothetical protein I7I48_05513 [Histoplasma ohiense]|nr:hypothetical protein I7I48_05513 [Histoplasma ohiense (nom. inval.)]